MRTIKAGLDYGTSASKAVFWDDLSPGSPKAYAVRSNSDIRLSSSVALVDDRLHFGGRPQTRDSAKAVWYESVKMRVAGEAKRSYREFCYGGTPNRPTPLSFKDLAILTVWHLRSALSNAVSAKLNLKENEFALSVTLGVPRCFFEDVQLKSVFLEIAVKSFELADKFRFPGTEIKIADAIDALRACQDFSASDFNEKDWLRSEAEAAMYWPVRSPEIQDGIYAEVDIGAGTTNASVVGIWPISQQGRWIKQNLGFHGAFSRAVGMDAVDEIIAQANGILQEECLGIRGNEEKLLCSDVVPKLEPVLDSIFDAYEFACRRARARMNSSEKQRFPAHSIFVAGGGSRIKAIVDFIAEHAHSSGQRRKIRQIEPPADLFHLDGQPIRKEEMAFISPAYGLSFSSEEVPDEYSCEEEQVRMPRVRGLSVIYEK